MKLQEIDGCSISCASWCINVIIWRVAEQLSVLTSHECFMLYHGSINSNVAGHETPARSASSMQYKDPNVGIHHSHPVQICSNHIQHMDIWLEINILTLLLVIWKRMINPMRIQTHHDQHSPQLWILYDFLFIMRFFVTASFFPVTFWSPKWRSLNHWKGHLTHPKRSLGRTWQMSFPMSQPFCRSWSWIASHQFVAAERKGGDGFSQSVC